MLFREQLVIVLLFSDNGLVVSLGPRQPPASLLPLTDKKLSASPQPESVFAIYRRLRVRLLSFFTGRILDQCSPAMQYPKSPAPKTTTGSMRMRGRMRMENTPLMCGP